MANGSTTHSHEAVPMGFTTGKKNVRVVKKRLELEQEVEELYKSLEKEEKTHQILESAMQPNGGLAHDIPSFLPKEVKELLAELVMVEEEIKRLESEISKIQQGLTSSQAPKSYDQHNQQRESFFLPSHQSSEASVLSLPVIDRKKEISALQTKPLFFISQAMTGHFGLHGFATKKEAGILGVETTSKMENQNVSRLQEKMIRKSGILGEASLQIFPPIKAEPPNLLEYENGIATKLWNLEVQANSCTPLKSNQKWQPNKLSESIMKCLICIFLRLMRASRTIELEKSSVLSKSTRRTLSSRSFSTEDNLNLKTSLPKQQDPYGIFKIQESLRRDIGPYKNFVICISSSLDIKGMSSCIPLMKKLRVLLNSLRDVDLRFLTHQQKLAFWINLHNTSIMHGFLEHGLPSNPNEIQALRNEATLKIGGNKLSALTIEKSILRQNTDKRDIDGMDMFRSIYGLDRLEPNVTFALCCANKSSPAVRIYTSNNISSELEKAKLEYLQASIVVTSTEKLMIPKLLLWNMNDFANDLDSLLRWICNQLPTSGSLRKSMATCMKGQYKGLASKIMDILPYEFDFQYLLPM